MGTNYPCRLPGANRRDRAVAVPDGYAPKTEGYCREGDLYWEPGFELWMPVQDAASHLGAPCWKVVAVIAPSTTEGVSDADRPGGVREVEARRESPRA